MRSVALKIDVDTLRGTEAGVPALVSALTAAEAGATFYFSLGPDHTGRALKRVFRRGFLSKVVRTSVVSHYGLRTLAYGVLLPGPDIGKRAGDAMRAARAAGFDVGVHCHDHVLWQDYVMQRDAAWTHEQLQRACDAYERVFAERPTSHAAAGWQINDHGLRLESTLGFHFASDARGTGPFMPTVAGRATGCPQLPTTLPTLDELIGRMSTDAALEAVLAQSREERPWGHVFTAHAELEGMQLLPLFQQLLASWRREGFEIISMTTLANRLQGASLPLHEIVSGTVPGRSGTLACQSDREVARAVA